MLTSAPATAPPRGRCTQTAMRSAMEVHQEKLGEQGHLHALNVGEAFGDFFRPPPPRPELFQEPRQRVGQPPAFISKAKTPRLLCISQAPGDLAACGLRSQFRRRCLCQARKSSGSSLFCYTHTWSRARRRCQRLRGLTSTGPKSTGPSRSARGRAELGPQRHAVTEHIRILRARALRVAEPARPGAVNSRAGTTRGERR